MNGGLKRDALTHLERRRAHALGRSLPDDDDRLRVGLETPQKQVAILLDARQENAC
jgi:hypothetical protein